MAETIVIEHPDCEIVQEAVFEMIRRSKDGIKKFGCDMAGAKMTVRESIMNAREEAMDQVVYLSKALYEFDKIYGVPLSPATTTVKSCGESCADCIRSPKKQKKGQYVSFLKGELRGA